MGSHGAQVEYLGAFLHTARWRASVEEDNSYQHLHEELEARHQIVDEEVMRIKIWMGRDQMGTDTSLMV